jgi:hypothetical protein
MRRVAAGIVCVCGIPFAILLLGVAALAQNQAAQQPGAMPGSSDGGVREVLESIVIPPIPSAPFAATLDTEWVRYTPDGATITLVNERHVARDSRGRIYEERWTLVPKDGSIPSRMNWIQIADPNKKTLYNCSTDRHVCELRKYDPTLDLSAAIPKPQPIGSVTRGDRTWEDLGSRNIAGVETVGTRETTTIQPGKIGNDQPITTMTEYWHSQELGINLLSIRSGAMVGKQTFTITELNPAEPDSQLFELPTGFSIDDQRKSPPISW